jgi:hypothetical protein
LRRQTAEYFIDRVCGYRALRLETAGFPQYGRVKWALRGAILAEASPEFAGLTLHSLF